jgi:hypothetical protein
LGKGVKEGRLLIMDTRAINIDNGKGEVVSSMGEGRGDGELVNRVMHKLESLIIPSRNYIARGPNRRFKNKMPKGGR